MREQEVVGGEILERVEAVARFLWEHGERNWSAALAVKALRFAPGLANVLARTTRIADL